MTIEEIYALETAGQQIAELQKRITPIPPIEKYKAQWDPATHDVMSDAQDKRPNKKILKEDGSFDRTEYVARIPLALQKVIVSRANSFLFSNKPLIEYDSNNPFDVDVVAAINKVLVSAKELALNRTVGEELMKSSEVAELWYTVQEENNLYGFKSKFKLKRFVFSPSKGDTLYPLFDETGDLIAFSRGYTVNVNGKEEQRFDSYTKIDTRQYILKEGQWTLAKDPVANVIGKIPIVYCTQGEAEWTKVQNLIERLEKLASNFADTNDYHGSPTIMVEGQITGFARKGEQGKILQGDQGSRAYYLSWDRAPEAIKLEKDMLVDFIYTLTQTPNINFDNLKGLGGVSGIALKLMFMDAHLKVEEKKSIVVEYLNRRMNIIKSFLGAMNVTWKGKINQVETDCDITPYMIDDLKSQVEIALLANGNNPIVSQKTSVKLSGLVDENDVDSEIAQINAEEKLRNTYDLSEPTM